MGHVSVRPVACMPLQHVAHAWWPHWADATGTYSSRQMGHSDSVKTVNSMTGDGRLRGLTGLRCTEHTAAPSTRSFAHRLHGFPYAVRPVHRMRAVCSSKSHGHTFTAIFIGTEIETYVTFRHVFGEQPFLKTVTSMCRPIYANWQEKQARREQLWQECDPVRE
jgi:hypothetical protein